MDTYYLIDFENVNSDGLTGCNKLSKSDHIIIFFTKNAMKINMSDIADHGEASLDMIEVPPGKQSTDIHIGSYIGFLVGINREKGCSIAVISSDTDFDNVIKFWKSKGSMNISRAKQIGPADEKPPAVTPSPKTADNAVANSRTMLNNTVMQLLKKAGFDNDVIGFTASAAVKNLGIKNGKQVLYRAIISKYGQDKGLKIYNCIKKEL